MVHLIALVIESDGVHSLPHIALQARLQCRETSTSIKPLLCEQVHCENVELMASTALTKARPLLQGADCETSNVVFVQ
jgi:hypothetical protein